KDALDNVAVELESDVAVRHQSGRQGALDEDDVAGRLQPLQTDGRLEFPRPQPHPWRESPVDVGVLQDRLPLAEVRHDPEVEELADGPFDDRPGAAELEGVGRRLHLVVAPETSVRLQQGAYLQLMGAVGRLDDEAVLAGDDRGGVLRLAGADFLLDLLLPLEDLQLLLELLQAL